MNIFEDYFDLLKQLIRSPSVVGAEYPYFFTLKRELEELGIQTTLYEGMLVAQGNDPSSGYISSHVDRHGLICTGPNEFQYAAYINKNKGDLTGKSVSEQTYYSLVDRFIDQSVQAYNQCSGSYKGIGQITSSYVCERRKNLIFEIEGLEDIEANTPIAFVDKLSLDDEYLSGQLDNVVTNAMVIYLYQLGYQGTAFFTAEEEAGKSWRYLLEWFQRFDINTQELLIVDTSPYSELEMLDTRDVVFRKRDIHAVFKSPLLKKMTNICKKHKISYEYKDAYLKERNQEAIKEGLPKNSLGSTELGRIIFATKGAIQGTTLQIPTINYHTTNETARAKSITQAIKILRNLYLF
jgi:putative aminopeptidase FrvX